MPFSCSIWVWCRRWRAAVVSLAAATTAPRTASTRVRASFKPRSAAAICASSASTASAAWSRSATISSRREASDSRAPAWRSISCARRSAAACAWAARSLDLVDGLAGRLEELLAALDHRAELGLALVPVGHLAGQLVQPLAAGGEGGLLAVQLGGEAGLARGGGGEVALQAGEAGAEQRPAAEQHLLEQAAVLDLLLLVAAGGAGLALERAQRALDLGHDVVQAQQVGGRLLELDLGDALPLPCSG